MKKILLTLSVMAVMMLSLQSQNFPEEILQSDPFKVWKPVQYTLEWDTIPGARYRLFSCGQAMNDNYWSRDTNGVWTSVVNTNKDFSPFYPARSIPNELGPMVTWTNDTGVVETFRAPPTNAWSFDYTTNRTMVLQGKSQAGIKWYVVAVLNNTNMYRISNIASWPTNWTTAPSTNYVYQTNPILLYEFKEGVGTNIFSSAWPNSPSVNLSVSNINNIQWLTNGLRIVTPSTARSTNFSKVIVDRIIQANAMSIETWVTPNNITQSGPARIVSISTNTGFRNFTMGPSGTNYNARLRTTTTSLNALPELSATNTVTTSKTHVVFTRTTSGQAKLFINGVVKATGIIGGDLSNWDKTYELLLFNENTDDRPWLGTIHSLALYDKALSDSEVKLLHNPPSISTFELKLIRVPVGPPMFINHNPPRRPQATTGAIQ